MMVPPFFSAEGYNGWFPIFHVKQENNGTSWIASKSSLSIENLDPELPRSIFEDRGSGGAKISADQARQTSEPQRNRGSGEAKISADQARQTSEPQRNRGSGGAKISAGQERQTSEPQRTQRNTEQ